MSGIDWILRPDPERYFCNNPLECNCARHPVSVWVRALSDGRTYNRSYCQCCGHVYGAKIITADEALPA